MQSQGQLGARLSVAVDLVLEHVVEWRLGRALDALGGPEWKPSQSVALRLSIVWTLMGLGKGWTREPGKSRRVDCWSAA